MKRTFFGILCAATMISGVAGAGRLVAAQTTSSTTSAGSVENRIERRLHDDAILKKHDVKVSVADGVATLKGTVATASQRTRAARLANVKGVTRVDNQIAIDNSARGTSGAIDTAANKTKAGTNKAIDKSKEGAQTAVEKTKEGTATGLAKAGQGIKKVGSEVTDGFILASVKARFFGEDALKGSDINVDCDGHVVTLKGTVPNAAARAKAIDLAQKTDGVDRVVDRLTIGPKK